MSIHRHFRSLALASAALMLASCAAKGPYPSLEPRAVEAEFANDAEPQPPAPAPRDPAIAPHVAALTQQARAGDSVFETALAKARSATAKARAAQSEAWIEAQQAISRAESARAPTTEALADLTAYALEQTRRGANPADLQAIVAAIDEVEAMAAGQSQRLDELKGALSSL